MDKRRCLARDGVAAEHLRGTVEDCTSVPTTRMRITVPVTPFWREPEPDPRRRHRETEGLYNEPVAILMERNGMALAQLTTDDYVGWVDMRHLAPLQAPHLEAAVTHRIHVPSTFVYPEASIKSPPICQLSVATPLQALAEQGRFIETSIGYVWQQHTSPIDAHNTDPIDVALGTAASLLGAPYLWGGRSGLGLDCSALVQLSLAIAGIQAPRDSDMQEAEIGAYMPIDTPPQRGDLLFWAGHVGWVESSTTLLHANAYHMQVAREPLEAACERIAASGTPLRSLKRLSLDMSSK